MPGPSPAWRASMVVDLGFGDAGKGATVDAWVEEGRAQVVVRFHGGAQAGHTVVRDTGQVHVFSQWGAGSFHPGVTTVHLAPVVLHPGAYAVETARLEAAGAPPLAGRFVVDERCLLISPIQQAAGRLRELARVSPHGTCGIGFGEAVGDALSGGTLRAGDLRSPSRLRWALAEQQERKRAELAAFRGLDRPLAAPEWALLDDPTLVDRVAERWPGWTRDWQVLSPERLRQRLAQPLILEGAQGLLLDQDLGFTPHNTWSDCTPAGGWRALRELGLDHEPEVWGVVRSYQVRHGAGPMPSEDPSWTFHEPHNPPNPWQGALRQGPLDGVLLRYARRLAGPLAGLRVTHLDRVTDPWPVVEAWEVEGRPTELRADWTGEERSAVAWAAVPVRRALAAADLRGWVAEQVGAPVRVGSFGPTTADLRSFDT